MTYITKIALSIACIVATGCGSAQITRQDAHAGTIRIEGAYMQAVSEARWLAVEHCQGRVELIESGDVYGDNVVAFVCVDAPYDAAVGTLASSR